MCSESERLPKPHLAFLASPGLGHIIPLYEFAALLVSQHNFEVSFLVISTGSTVAQNSYLNSNRFPDLHIVNLPDADMSGLLFDDTTPVVRITVMVQESIRSLPSVLAGLNRPKPKAIVIDMFCTGVFDVLKDEPIPVYVFCTTSLAYLAFFAYLPTLDRIVVVVPEHDVKVPGCSPIRTQDLVDPTRNRKNIDYQYMLTNSRRLSMANGIFVNSWGDLEPVTLKAIKHERFFIDNLTPPVYPIGPVTRKAEPVLSDYEKEIIAWLDKQPKESVLFVALGSGGTLTSEQLTELAWGLELSQQRFIIVVRKPSDCTSSTFFSAGSDQPDDPKAYLPDGFVARTNRVGRVVSSWAPQITVLDHPSTGAFLSHCGWNSTVESLKHGVPIITWPLYAEQRMNATMLVNDIGVAVKMPVVGDRRETAVVVGRKEIESVVRVVMEGEEGKKVRIRAKELEASGRDSLSRDGSSYGTLARVAVSWN